MAYSNSVGIMPGAATEKLPFVHSDFKPRSKFAKSFGGFKKFTRHGNGALARCEGQKLPVIHYSVENQRNLIAMGTKDQGDRPEYPGFSGTKRLLKKKDNNNSSAHNTVHPAISGSFTRSQANAMKHYLSLPNLNLIHHQQQPSETGAFHNFRSHTNYNDKNKQRHHKHNTRDPEEIQFMNYLQQLQQQHQQQQQQHNRTHNNNDYNMDSLFIVDDDDDYDNDDNVMLKQQQHSKTMIVGNGVRFKDPLVTTTAHTNQHETFHRGSPNNNNSFPGSGGQEVMDPFAMEVDKKLRDARGKSGMKRDRRREPDHMRVLGDVVTAERMHQLLLPRKSEAPLTFEENV